MKHLEPMVIMSVLIPATTRDGIKAIALRQGRSASEVYREALARHIKAKTPKGNAK